VEQQRIAAELVELLGVCGAALTYHDEIGSDDVRVERACGEVVLEPMIGEHCHQCGMLRRRGADVGPATWSGPRDERPQQRAHDQGSLGGVL